ncbi:MAG: MerR family DNA-binding protein [Pseudomonadota bacterium]
MLRRITVIKVAQRADVALTETADALSHLPKDRVPVTADWARLAKLWHVDVTARIESLSALRDEMAICIGCGCLSVARCPFADQDDPLGPEASVSCLI